LGYDLSDVDADLWHLRNRGILARLAGLVIGRLRVSDPAAIHRLCGLAEEITRPFGYPVVAQFELGHSDPVLTLPIGMMARLDGAELAITDVAVC
jgi:muramoyltetrapeptide carboxypeptidase